MILSKETKNRHLVYAIDLLDSYSLSFPRLRMNSDDCLRHCFESVDSERMTHWVFWCAYILVVALSVLRIMMRVQKLSIGNRANYFVVPGLLVDQLVSS